MLRLAMLLLTLLIATPRALAQEWVMPPPSQDVSVALIPPPALPADYITVDGLFATVSGNPADRATLHRLAEHAAQSVPAIAERMGVGTGPTLRVTLVDSAERFNDLQPGAPPAWADGTAWPHRSLVYLRSPRLRKGTASPLEQVLDHEITHVLLGQAFGTRPVPRWLQEGLAQWVAGEYGPQTTERLARGLLGRGLLSLEDITQGFPQDPLRAELAYAQSADLVAWIADEYGPEAVITLVRELASGAPVNAAFRTATGRFAHELDAEWRGRLESSGLWVNALFNQDMMWGLGAPVLLAGYLLVRRRNRRRLDDWRREEALRDALYKAIERGVVPPEKARDPWSTAAWRDEGPWMH